MKKLLVLMALAAAVGLISTPAAAQAGSQGKLSVLRGTLSAVDAASLTVDLTDGTSVTIRLDRATRILVPGPNARGQALLVGMHVVVTAVADANNRLMAQAVLAVPGQPGLAHRVGDVTAYEPGSSLTIRAVDGSSYTFDLPPDMKILPAQLAASLSVGSSVTVVAPREPEVAGWVAVGVVVQQPHH
jgi:hypothetical protein